MAVSGFRCWKGRCLHLGGRAEFIGHVEAGVPRTWTDHRGDCDNHVQGNHQHGGDFKRLERIATTPVEIKSAVFFQAIPSPWKSRSQHMKWRTVTPTMMQHFVLGRVPSAADEFQVGKVLVLGLNRNIDPFRNLAIAPQPVQHLWPVNGPKCLFTDKLSSGNVCSS